ncbi:hypothetical protein PHYBOEH_009049 [Phytophthora boehmeriae]|uniref:Uncharacterized protein n=1 Tax=Phytophthora boehmeriae TaxID=109152 RepID=A0A8T1X2B7_9STRA|nr:hypothetical protein PHYBOEH_009049 [Phytophthora boehmeriae]
MADTAKVLRDDDDAFMGIHPPPQRRHTMADSSSRASSPTPPVVWKVMMPTSRRSSLASADELTRLKRSISDATSLEHRPGDKSAFALHDIDASSVLRAKLIRDNDEDRYGRFRNFFKNYEPELAKEIQGRSEFTREQVNAWVNYIVNPKVLRCIMKTNDSTQEVLELLMVAAAIAKYGESELKAKDKRGDLSALQNTQQHTFDEYSHGRQEKRRASVGMEFIVRINDRLPEERRVGGVLLREILAHATTMEIEDDQIGELSGQDERLTQMVARVQTQWFQDAMLKANGKHLYDAIRQILSNVNSSVWDAAKDKPELKQVRIQRSDRLGAAVENIEKSESTSSQRRPRAPPPPRPETRRATISNDTSTVATSQINRPVKVDFSSNARTSPAPSQVVQEKEEEILIVGTDKTRRKLLPLGAVPRVQRSHGLPLHPSKRALHMMKDPADDEPVAIKAHEHD